MSGMMSRRQLLKLAGGASLGTALAACTGIPAPPAVVKETVIVKEAPESQAAPAEAVSLSFWHIWGSQDDPAYKQISELIQDFQTANPNIKVEPSFVQFTESGSFQQKLQAAVAGGVPPEVATLSGSNNYAAIGGAVPLDTLIETDTEDIQIDDFIPGQMQRQTWLGKIYGIPAWADANFLLWWNKDHFEESGLDPEKPPKTWSELKTYSEKLIKKDASSNNGRLGFIPTLDQGWFLAYLYTAGDDYVFDMNQTPPKVTFNDENGVRALQFMVDLTDLNGGITDQTSFSQGFQSGANNPFIIGQVSMVATGQWFYQDLKRYAPDMKYGVATFPIADDGGKVATTSGGFGYSIPKGAKHPNEGWKFIKMLTSKDSMLKLAKNAGMLPTRLSLYSDPFFQGDPYMKVFVEALRYAHGWGEGPWGAEFWDTTMVKARDNALYKRMTPKQALDEAAQITQAAIDRFFKQ